MNEINDTIESLKKCVEEHYRRLNFESTWLLVATIGCWSISVSWVQLLAIALIFYFLFRNVFDGLTLNTSYSKELKDIRNRIEVLDIEETEKDQFYGKVWKIENKYLTISATFKHNTKFLAAMIFYCISAFYFGFKV